MADTTINADRATREEVAERLRSLANELEEGEQTTVRTGNKTVDLRPPETIAYELSVRERSSILRGQRETITLKLDWKPPGVSEEAAATGEAE